MERSSSELDLPGFRFHPTEEELLDFYLQRAAHRQHFTFDVIGTLNLYRHDPWELPNLAKIGEREWYFFVPRDRRQANGGRPNRTTEKGFWKATGSDRPIHGGAESKRIIGLKKTLVFYTGRAPRGCKTDWVMNEYRLPDHTKPKEDIVLCKVYRKATPLKELEQRAAMEEAARASHYNISMGDIAPSPEQAIDFQITSVSLEDFDENPRETKEEDKPKEVEVVSSLSTFRSVNLPELEVPPKNGLDWMHDSFLTQLRSPWLDQWSPYANILNF